MFLHIQAATTTMVRQETKRTKKCGLTHVCNTSHEQLYALSSEPKINAVLSFQQHFRRKWIFPNAWEGCCAKLSRDPTPGIAAITKCGCAFWNFHFPRDVNEVQLRLYSMKIACQTNLPVFTSTPWPKKSPRSDAWCVIWGNIYLFKTNVISKGGLGCTE